MRRSSYDERGLVPCVVQDWRTRRGADARLHERAGARAHARDGRAAPVEPLARRAVAQGRNERQHPDGAGAAAGLRRRHAARAGGAGRPGLPHRRADLLSPRRARAARPARDAAGARADARARARGSARRAPTRSSCSTIRARIGEKVMEEAEEVARAAREESDERVDEEAADVLYHLLVLLHSRGRALADAERVLDEPSLLAPRRLARAVTAVQIGAEPRAGACAGWRRAQPDPAAPQLHRRLRDAGVGVSEAARAGAGAARVPARVRRAGPAGRALVVHRLPPALGAALVARRRRRPLRAGRRARRALQPGADRDGAGGPPFTGGAVGFFGYDLVRTVEPLGEPNPDPLASPTWR